MSHARTQARLPILEHTDVFEKPLGPTSDVVNKEMYSFTPPGSDDRVTLRPEGTAGRGEREREGRRKEREGRGKEREGRGKEREGGWGGQTRGQGERT